MVEPGDDRLAHHPFEIREVDRDAARRLDGSLDDDDELVGVAVQFPALAGMAREAVRGLETEAPADPPLNFRSCFRGELGQPRLPGRIDSVTNC